MSTHRLAMVTWPRFAVSQITRHYSSTSWEGTSKLKLLCCAQEIYCKCCNDDFSASAHCSQVPKTEYFALHAYAGSLRHSRAPLLPDIFYFIKCPRHDTLLGPTRDNNQRLACYDPGYSPTDANSLHQLVHEQGLALRYVRDFMSQYQERPSHPHRTISSSPRDRHLHCRRSPGSGMHWEYDRTKSST